MTDASIPVPRAAPCPPDPSFTEKLAFLRARLQPETEIETHAAHLFLTANRVWKIKRPVALAGFDHRTLATREHACREELRLNRELAGPRVYFGLEALCFGPEGLRLVREDVDETIPGLSAIDWLVRMRRLPEAAMLDLRIEVGRIPASTKIDAIARVLAPFYRQRQRAPVAAESYLRHLRHEARVNRSHLREMRIHLKSRDLDALTRAQLTSIDAIAPEIVQRAAARMVIEGHGDLRPEHVCLTTPPVIFDRVETSSAARIVDIGDELGYLGLECELLGAPALGPALERAMEGYGFPRLSRHVHAALGGFRCLTRARLCLDHLRDPVPRRPEHWPVQAERYLALARRMLGEAGD